MFHKCWRNLKGQLRMDTGDTGNIGHRSKTNKTETNTTVKAKKINNTDLTNKQINTVLVKGMLFMVLTKQTNNKTLVHINFIFSW